MINKKSINTLLMISLILFLGFLINPGIKESNASDDPGALFVEYTESVDTSAEMEHIRIRSRYVKINYDLFAEAEILLNIFEDVSFISIKDRIENISGSKYTLFGQIIEDEYGYMIMVVNGDKITGNIVVHGIMYQVRPVSDGVHIISEIQ